VIGYVRRHNCSAWMAHTLVQPHDFFRNLGNDAFRSFITEYFEWDLSRKWVDTGVRNSWIINSCSS
jgi:hypothetical protein